MIYSHLQAVSFQPSFSNYDAQSMFNLVFCIQIRAQCSKYTARHAIIKPKCLTTNILNNDEGAIFSCNFELQFILVIYFHIELRRRISKRARFNIQILVYYYEFKMKNGDILNIFIPLKNHHP